MQLKESTRKYTFLVVVAIIFVGLITSKVLASKQDEQFSQQDVMYQQASQLYEEGSYEQAATLLNDLLLLQPKSEVVNYMAGITAANIGDYQQAVILFQKALDINPHKVEDAMFMLQFAEVLFFAERYADAQVVLEKCREWAWAPEAYPTYQERVTELLTQIETM